MGKTLLGPDEKIEAFRNQKTLRLVTTKTKASVLIKKLDEMLKQITTKMFPVVMITTEPIDEAVLEELGRITNAHIRISSTFNRVRNSLPNKPRSSMRLNFANHISRSSMLLGSRLRRTLRKALRPWKTPVKLSSVYYLLPSTLN